MARVERFVLCPSCKKEGSKVYLIVISRWLLMCNQCGELFQFVAEDVVANRRLELREVVVAGDRVIMEVKGVDE